MSTNEPFHPPLDGSGRQAPLREQAPFREQAPPPESTEPGRPEPPRLPGQVLIISAEMGEGHNAAARALREAIDEAWPGCRVEQLDTVELGGSRFAHLVRRAYSFQLSRLPWTYQAFYDSLGNSHRVANLVKAVVGRFFGRRLAPVLAGRCDDLIISTYPFGSAALAWLRQRRGLSSPLVTYIPAFHVHPVWAYPQVDLHFVMYDTASDHARTPGFRASARLGAPPVRRGFGEVSRAKGRAEVGRPAEEFMVLVTGGAWGLGQIAEGVRGLLGCPVPVHVVAVCGRNARLAAQLRSLPDADRLTVLDYVDNMPALMAAADVVVTNGAGVTVLESLCTPRPVIAFCPLVGHGRAATSEMVRRDLALVADDVPTLVNEVARLATDDELAGRMERAGQTWAAGRDLRGSLTEMAALASRPRPR